MKSTYLESFRTLSRKTSNFHSYLSIKGNYYLTETELRKIIYDENILKNYAFNENPTKYYKLFFDIDMKKGMEYMNIINGRETEVVDYIIEQINKVLNITMIKPDIRYVYADKNQGYGIHLFYPGVIVNARMHKYICEKVIYDIMETDDKKYQLGKNWRKILDTAVYLNRHVRMFFFYKDGGYYKPNRQKSTYFISPTDKWEQFKLCMVGTQFKNYDMKLQSQLDRRLLGKLNNPKNKIRNKIKKILLNKLFKIREKF